MISVQQIASTIFPIQSICIRRNEEPLSVAVHAVATVGCLRTAQNVLVMGAGPVGLLSLAVAKGLGAAKIIAVDINEERLDFAKSYAATDIYFPASNE